MIDSVAFQAVEQDIFYQIGISLLLVVSISLLAFTQFILLKHLWQKVLDKVKVKNTSNFKGDLS